jgi:hypothetical protein
MTTLEYRRRQQALEAWQNRMAFRVLACECLLIMIAAGVLMWSFLK